MPNSSQVFVLLPFFILFYLVQKLIDYRKVVRTVNDWPGFRTLFSDRFLFFPFKARGISPGVQWSFYSHYQEYADAGWDVLCAVNVFPTAYPTFYVADPVITKECARARFPKPLEQYEILKSFGSNILVTESDIWKRQRKIAAPAFSEKTNRLVWDETVHILEDLFENTWGGKAEIDVPHVMDVTVSIALLVMGAAAFGRRISWNEDKIAPPGHTMTFKEALHQVSHNLLLKVIVPSWMFPWGPPNFRRFARAYEELETYIVEMIDARRAAEVKEERHDLFSNLLDANEIEHDSGAKLSNEELIGNVFLFLVAGYETTAHTLAYAFVLLALYPDEQEAFYQNLKSVLPSDRSPTYEEFSSLSYALAVLNETLRWFPPVSHIPKKSAEDTVFSVKNAAGQKVTIPVPRDSVISICIPSLHHNPHYWDEPDAFKPARFLSNYPRDAFLPFSGGPRGCIGRGFAETEGVAVLALIISKYKVEVKDEPQFRGETFDQRKARLLKSQHSLTIYPQRAPLVFTRR